MLRMLKLFMWILNTMGCGIVLFSEHQGLAVDLFWEWFNVITKETS